MDFQRHVFAEPYWGWLCRGVLVTLAIAALTTVVAGLLAVGVAGCRLSRRRLARAAGAAYVEVFRNLPPLPLLLFLLFALPGWFHAVSGRPFPTGLELPLLVVGLSLNTSAYLAEILRAAVRAVPAAQAEAARVLGLKPRAIVIRVIAPQALRIALPALGTRLVHNLKNASLAVALPLPLEFLEVTGQAGRIAGQTFAWAEPLVAAGAIYLGLGLLLSAGVARLSRRFSPCEEAAR